MNEDEFNLCKNIYNKLSTRKVFRLFWNNESDLTNPAIEHPVNFELIMKKLETKIYDSVTTFIGDVATVIENAMVANSPESIRYAAAQQLSEYFNKIIEEIEPLSGTIATPIRVVTSDFLNSIHPPGELTKIKFDSSKTPGSVLFQTDSDPEDLDTLFRDIKFLTSTTLAYELAAFTRQLQPNIINIRSEVSLNISLLTEENKPKMRAFVTHLLKKAATGEVDPFARPFGQRVPPVRMYERGFPSPGHATIVPLK